MKQDNRIMQALVRAAEEWIGGPITDIAPPLRRQPRLPRQFVRMRMAIAQVAAHHGVGNECLRAETHGIIDHRVRYCAQTTGASLTRDLDPEYLVMLAHLGAAVAGSDGEVAPRSLPAHLVASGEAMKRRAAGRIPPTEIGRQRAFLAGGAAVFEDDPAADQVGIPVWIGRREGAAREQHP